MAQAAISEPCEPIALGDFFLEDRRFPAVYFLYHRGECVYVGQSKTLRLRIDNHIAQGVKLFDAVAFIRCPVNRLTAVEADYIRRLAPKYNACGLTKKTRDRLSWQRKDSHKGFRKSGMWADPRDIDLDNVEFCDALAITFEPGQVGEFLGVTESQARQWQESGKITDISFVGLMNFIMANSREVARAQDYYETL